MRQFWAILAPHWRMGLWAMLATVGVTAAELAIPLITGNIVDLAVGRESARVFAGLGPVGSATLILVLMAVFRWACQFLRRYTAGRLSFDVQHGLRLRLLDTLLGLDGPAQDKIRTGQVVSRSISDVQSIQGLVAMLPLAAGNVLLLAITLVLMVSLSWPLALASLIWLPAIAWLARHSKRPIMRATNAAQQQAADLATHVEQTIVGIHVVQGFAQQPREVDAVARAAVLLYRARLAAARVLARFQPLLEQLPQAALVATIVVGGWMATQGLVSIGVFVAFSMYVSRLTGAVRMIGNLTVRLHSGLASVHRVCEITDLRPELPVGTRAVPEGPLELSFAGVHFGDALRGFSLTIPAGKCVVAVGPPAGGKTMAVQLAARFYDPDAGAVRLNGIDLRELDRTQLRNAMAVVFDEAFLFEASVRENLTLGAAVSDAELWRVLHIAQAAEFVRELSDGLDAPIGERGVTLSGGQRQRLALARALLRRPRLLILDDATSAIDAATESRIFAALEQEFANTTVFAITHKHSMVHLADSVAVVDSGRVTAFATPAEEAWQLPEFRAVMDAAGAPADSAPADAALGGSGLDASLPAPEVLPEGPMPASVTVPVPFSLLPFVRQVRAGIIGIIVLLLAGVGADLAFPSLVRYAVDQGVGDGDRRALVIVAIGGGVLVVGAWLVGFLRTKLAAQVGERLLYALRVKTYKHVLDLDLAYFERTRTGSILTRMTTDIDTLSNFLQNALAQSIVAAATLVGVAVILLVTSPTLALVALAAIPLVVLATVVFRRITARLYTQAREELSAMNAEFHEAISGLRTVQMHGSEPQTLEHFERSCEKYRRTRIRSQIAVAIYFPGAQAIGQLSRAAVIGVGATLVLRGDISAGVLIAFVLYMSLLFDPIQELSQIFDAYQQAKVGLRRIAELLSEQPQVGSSGEVAASISENGEEQAVQRAMRGELRLEHVSFSYGGAPVLRNLNVTLRPGTTVALVGHTGAGKTTVMKLLARFYDPTEGCIRASGTDLRNIRLPLWRSGLGIVPQEPHLFAGTIAENIAYGRPHAEPAEIISAARRVGALESIAEIEGNFQYRIGEHGRGLSAGQRQLIALARAELVEPQLLLLDEATATLDPATERAVLEAAHRVTTPRTSVVVAHRLATAAQADRILVLQRGYIIEDGTHAELLANEGSYASMWRAHQ